MDGAVEQTTSPPRPASEVLCTSLDPQQRSLSCSGRGDGESGDLRGVKDKIPGAEYQRPGGEKGSVPVDKRPPLNSQEGHGQREITPDKQERDMPAQRRTEDRRGKETRKGGKVPSLLGKMEMEPGELFIQTHIDSFSRYIPREAVMT